MLTLQRPISFRNELKDARAARLGRETKARGIRVKDLGAALMPSTVFDSFSTLTARAKLN